MPALHELSDKELREKLSTGELSDKKATIALNTFGSFGCRSCFRELVDCPLVR
jgi:hypothetical protein